jgi:hypothetical protein
MSPRRSVTRFSAALAFAISLGALGVGCGGTDEVRPAQWSFVYPAIIKPSCATASCHSDFTQRSGVNFGDSDVAYLQMVCRHFVVSCFPIGHHDPCSTDPNATVKTAPAADCLTRQVPESQIIHQLNANGAPRMPPDFALPDADIALIGAWIKAGTEND